MTDHAAPTSNPFRVLMLIRSLAVGGAERQLTSLASGLAARGHTVAVHVQRSEIAPVHGAALRSSGVEISHGGYLRALRRARAFRPEVVYGFGPGPNVLATLLRPLTRSCSVVWSILGSERDTGSFTWRGRLVYDLERRFSRVPRLIIANSTAGVRAAVARGLPEASIVLILNGIDTEHFAPAPAARQPVRGGWTVGPEQTLVGVVARLHPAKGHATFLRAAALVADPNLRFVMIGSGPEEQREALRAVEREVGLSSGVIWAGERHDMPAVYSGLDLMCLPSETEGFPNVIGEAMACGVPCVVTDVGDAASIVGDLGFIAPPRDERSLAGALANAVARRSEDQDRWSAAVRARIVGQFSKDLMVTATEQALVRVRPPVTERRARVSPAP